MNGIIPLSMRIIDDQFVMIFVYIFKLKKLSLIYYLVNNIY